MSVTWTPASTATADMTGWDSGATGNPVGTTYYVSDTDTVDYYCCAVRLVGAAFSGTVTSATLTVPRFNDNTGTNGTVRIRCIAEADVAAFSTSAKPSARTYRSAFVDFTFPADAVTCDIDVTTIINDLLTAGYTYSGTQHLAIVIGTHNCGTGWGSGADIGYRSLWDSSSASPSLSITSGPSVPTGAAAGTSTALAVGAYTTNYPEVVAENSTDSGTADVTTFNAGIGSPANGERVVLIVSRDGTTGNADFATTPVGAKWKLLSNTPAGTSTTTIRSIAIYADCDGTEGATVAFTVATAEAFVSHYYRLAAGSFDPATAPEIAAHALTSGNNDPSAVTPSWGTANDLWICTLALDTNSAVPTAYPSGYANTGTIRSTNTTTAQRTRLAWCRKVASASSDDPATWTNASVASVAFTIAVRPSVSSGIASGVGSSTGTSTAAAVGSSIGVVSGVGSAAGTSTANARAPSNAVGTAAGTSTALGVSPSTIVNGTAFPTASDYFTAPQLPDRSTGFTVLLHGWGSVQNNYMFECFADYLYQDFGSNLLLCEIGQGGTYVTLDTSYTGKWTIAMTWSGTTCSVYYARDGNAMALIQSATTYYAAGAFDTHIGGIETNLHCAASLEYVYMFQSVLTLAQMESQRSQKAPIVTAWGYWPLELGSNASGNGGTALTTSGTPVAASDGISFTGGGTIVTGAGASAGTSTAAAVGASLVSGVGASTGTSTSAATGASLASGVGASAGVATAPGVGLAAFQAVGMAAGTSTASATGVAATTVTGAGESAGSSTAAGVGASFTAGVGSATGVATALSVGVAAAVGVGSAAGTSTSEARVPSLAVGSAAGTSTAAATGIGVFQSVGTAAGTSTAPGIGSALVSAAGASAGTSTAAAVGAALSRAAGTATGTSTASGVSALPTGAGTGISAGTSTAAAVGSSTAVAAGTSVGVATAAAVGSSLVAGVGSSAGTSVAAAAGGALTWAVGTAAGTSTALGAYSSDGSWSGLAAGNSTALGVGAWLAAGRGMSAGTSIVSGVGGSIVQAVGTSAGTSTALASSTNDITYFSERLWCLTLESRSVSMTIPTNRKVTL
jgi:hypothetical protein